MRTRHAVAAIALASSAITPILAGDAPRPRGVGPEFAKFYKATDSFTCINNPSIRIPVSQINDDVCDCPDGSDEPGTAACSYISPYSPPSAANYVEGQTNATLALPGFYCRNKGHRPAYIPFTYVNDGVCDYELCCDGSDEWDGVGGVKCEDKCKEIGKEWRKQDEQRQKSLNAAIRKRQELVVEAARLKKECEDRVQTLKTQVQATELKVADLEVALAETERRERARVVRAPKEGGKMGTLIGLARQRTDELRNTLQDIKAQRDDYKRRLTELEAILALFKEEYNPNFNDEGVKRAVRGWEDYIASGPTPPVDQAKERDLTEILKSDQENGLEWEEWQKQEDDTAVLYQIEEYLPKPIRDWVDKKLRDLRVMLIENGILAGSTEGSESKAVTDARNQLNTARADLTARKTERDTHEGELAKDYGPDDVFRALKDRCVEQESGEYTYELCWMGRTTQKPKKSGANTNMGAFDRFEWITVDDELPADGRGLGSGERLVMKYEKGQHCWNGPNRSTTVVLACAEKDEIWKIAEEEKCVYRMEVGTPAVCGIRGRQQQEQEQSQGQAKDEL